MSTKDVEYYKYKYYIHKYNLYYDICLYSNNIEVVKLGIENGAIYN